ncbi:CoA transferase [Azospirillum sp. RWY-5-1]|uniref:CoA transferase n=1 Tax=Azospirillum oleiclasticum TaxID=2735135 RepID=A0ABX2TDA8_9PROT|nr:CaiB/BaiF CoA-transferase family protein [Azospirillum oleiclasticum]NYZ14709.1 CoA transferase [Azospirillum oleiclasticum]NYZ22305.1 CoA transferase [Azospirillum oleiclasticum]
MFQKGVLAGRRVIELGSMIAAPFATHILDELGAEVIKIEPPEGETTRHLVRGGPSGTFIAYNRGKKSLCLNLQADDGRAAFRRLVAGADVVLHNLSPGAARKLGVTYEQCAELNPRIVFCHIRGYGPGPMQEEIASNPIAEAATGVMFSNRVNGRPSRLGPSYLDQFAGCYAAIAVLAALLDDTGEKASRNISFGLYETGLHIAARDLVGVQLKSHLLGRPETEPSPEFAIPGYGAYETRDGRWIYVVMLSDEHWRRFGRAVEMPADPDLATLRDRRRNRDRVEALVRDAVRRWDYDPLSAALAAAGVGHTEVLSADRVLAAPQAAEPRKFSDVPFAGYGFQSPDFPVASCRATAPFAPPPLLGEQTRDVLAALGYGAEQIDAMITAGAAVTADAAKPVWARAGGSDMG